jgi:hypothetical protein
MKKSKKDYDESTETISSFGQVFDSMEDELLIEMAYYYPQQLRDLCTFLTLDRQLALEEQKQSLKYKN